MTFAWHHPNYYKKLKKEAASSKLQATSFDRDSTGALPGNAESTVTSSKQQASSNKLQACDKLSRGNSLLDTSPKPQAPSPKLQAPSVKRYLNLGP